MDFAKNLAQKQSVVLAFTSTAVAAFLVSLWWWKSGCRMTTKRSTRKPESVKPCEWKIFGHVTGVKLYPLKSGHEVDLSDAEATLIGLKSGYLRDRFFIIYDEKGNFVTGRKYSKMVQIRVSAPDAGCYCFNAPGCSQLIVKVPEEPKERENRKFKCRLWNEKVCGIDTGDEAARWISQLLLNQSEGLRIGFYVPEFGVERRVSHFNQIYQSLTTEDTGAFSDLSAFLLIAEDSVAELNTRLDESDQVSCANFRPNLIVKFVDGGKPFDEDNWEWIRIGNEKGPIFRNVKPCTRCIFTTVDPEKGIRNEHKEPLETLKTYRKLTDPEALRLEGTAPVMGINLGLYVEGTVHVGDPVYVGKPLP
ncbi:mitochondrial amidoxime reducing component 2-like [Hetaerina americana]|uniref:mitochondrial amidoxime reducing component 2-like n=1 Tax=Hetaerina americana TaxID=62018 RepID=UPI003A7F5A41